MTKEKVESQFYSIGEVCDLLDVSRMSLIRWEDEKKITLSSIKTPGGHRKYRKTEVQDFLETWGKD